MMTFVWMYITFISEALFTVRLWQLIKNISTVSLIAGNVFSAVSEIVSCRQQSFSSLTLLVGCQEEHPVCKNLAMRC